MTATGDSSQHDSERGVFSAFGYGFVSNSPAIRQLLQAESGDPRHATGPIGRRLNRSSFNPTMGGNPVAYGSTQSSQRGTEPSSTPTPAKKTIVLTVDTLISLAGALASLNGMETMAGVTIERLVVVEHVIKLKRVPKGDVAHRQSVPGAGEPAISDTEYAIVEIYPAGTKEGVTEKVMR